MSVSSGTGPGTTAAETTGTETTAPRAAAAIPPAGEWHIDPVHSNVGFVATHLGFARVRGRFSDVDGTVRIGHDPEQATADVLIAAASVDTGVAMRDRHLRSGEFLDVERYPLIAFHGTGARRDGDHWTLDGELTILGTTKPVTLSGRYCGQEPFPFTGGQRLGFSARTTIDRRDFGLTSWLPLPGAQMFIGTTVDIELDISMVDGDISQFVGSVLGREIRL
jgi:polyisoprenoid-binding protein YceI